MGTADQQEVCVETAGRPWRAQVWSSGLTVYLRRTYIEEHCSPWGHEQFPHSGSEGGARTGGTMPAAGSPEGILGGVTGEEA